MPVPGSEFILETDILIPAIGQAVDLSFLGQDAGVELTKWNTVLVDQDTFRDLAAGIFCRGRLRDRARRACQGVREREEGRLEDRPVSSGGEPQAF